MNFGLTSDLSFVGLPCCFLCVGNWGKAMTQREKQQGLLRAN